MGNCDICEKNSELKEDEIRPDRLVQGQMDAFLSDVKWLQQFKSDFILVDCPACGSKKFVKTFEKYQLSFVMCSECETLFVNPRPTPEIIKNYLENSENYQYWNKYIFPHSESARREKIFKPRVERLIQICKYYNVRMDSLMEVGAGFGTFCEELQKRNVFKQIIAVEPTHELAETCRKKNINVIEKLIEEVTLESNSIDVIACFEVIEHLFSPKDFIKRCGSLLDSGGFLFLTCPNGKGFDILVLRNQSNSVDVEHLNYFNPASLSHLLKECGFEIVEIITPGKLDAELVRKKILSAEFNISTHPFLKQILIDEWDRVGSTFQDFLAANMLSSHMWIIARKK